MNLTLLLLLAFCCPVSLGVSQDQFDFVDQPPGTIALVSEKDCALVGEGEGAGGWSFEAGVLTASSGWDSVLTPKAHADFRMHLEFRVNAASYPAREKNGNSGVYLQQRYEVQILDSYGITPEDYQHWDCGSLYRLKKPDLPACKPAGEWQSYDILFRAARFAGERKVEDARVTVFQNDILIHDDVALPRKTGAGRAEGPEPLPTKLQGHGNAVGFRNVWIQDLELPAMPQVPAGDSRRASKQLPRPGKVFPVGGRIAFLIEPDQVQGEGPKPWVWYAPTLAGLPGDEEGWMIDRLLAEGVALAGIDVGESYGAPYGRKSYQAFYEHLTAKLGYANRPALLARSRGGLMLYSWAVEHPECVAGVAGIYPVCNLESYPGLGKAAPAFGLDAQGLAAALDEHNPVARVASLAPWEIPILHLHGDRDGLVPLEPNSALLAERYAAAGGPIEVAVQEGRGHDMWTGWFQSEALVRFLHDRAQAGAWDPAQGR